MATQNSKLIEAINALQCNDNELVKDLQAILIDYTRLLAKDRVNDINSLSSEETISRINFAFEVSAIIENLKSDEKQHEEL